MKHVWSPWRMKYIMHQEYTTECVFCKALQQPDSPENLIVARGKLSFVILNRFPYTSGHVMVVPYAHQPVLALLDRDIRSELLEMITIAEMVLTKEYNAEGFNIGANIGAAAGAGIADHLHFHIVPRWAGDTNFMSTLGETRVIPEMLEKTFERLKNAWPAATA